MRSECMGVWKSNTLRSEIKSPGEFQRKLNELLNLGWKIAGYSVDGKWHNVLLVKETKGDND